jgi:alanine-synthesizing transaminase
MQLLYDGDVSGFSKRTSWDTNESGYAAAVREARASGRRLYDLTVSNPTVCGFYYDAKAVLEPLAEARALTYDPDPRGMRSARQAVAAYYAEGAPGWVGAEVDPDALLLTTSTSEGYGFLFRLLCNAGDQVLVAQPSYPLFDLLADLEDVTLRSYPLFYDQGWWIDFAELERKITPRTRAILVVHPNNPTGHWTGRIEREQLQEICARHGLALIVDEVFLDYSLSGSGAGGKAQSFVAGAHPVLTFVLSGMSKIAGLPQMKLAWIAVLGPGAERAEAYARLEIIADTFLSMNAPAQLALPSWLASRGGIREQIRKRAQGNLAVLSEYAEERAAGEHSGLMLLRADAGWSAIVGLPGCAGEPMCVELLVRERGVIAHPGSFYGMGEANRAVVSLIGTPEDFAEGVARLLREKFQ